MKPLLEIIGGELADSLKKAGRTKTFREGEEIFAAGERANFLPIVLTGRVKMVSFPAAGKEVIIGIFGDGEMFAVPPVFDGGDYPASAFAMEKTTLLMLERKDFLRLLSERSEFSFAVIGWMSEMLREKTAAIQNLATASPERRAGNVLLRLAAKENSLDGQITIRLRRREIAEIAGMTTETTIRAIRRLADKKLIEIRHGKIVIGDPEPLREFLSR
jgi:cAMP-binding proteins - catabolite gene activator and regulatory subunit of cAMP-dependent protein kinases